MLYDKRWDKDVKADPFSLESLIAWLEKQPADKTYCYMDNGYCLLSQYFTYSGFQNVDVGGWDFTHGPKQERVSFSNAFENVAVEQPWTFGAALDRAREALSSNHRAGEK